MSSVDRPYKIRKSYYDTKSQISSYNILSNAILKCSKYPGYNVYDVRTGNLIYSCKEKEEETVYSDEESLKLESYENRVKKNDNCVVRFFKKIFNLK